MKITIKEPIEKPKSIFRLSIDFLHGDEDVTTDEHDYKTIEELSDVLIVLGKLEDSNDPNKYDKILKKNKAEWMRDIINDDMTCQGYYARIEDYFISYFDESGIEHDVEVEY